MAQKSLLITATLAISVVFSGCVSSFYTPLEQKVEKLEKEKADMSARFAKEKEDLNAKLKKTNEELAESKKNNEVCTVRLGTLVDIAGIVNANAHAKKPIRKARFSKK